MFCIKCWKEIIPFYNSNNCDNESNQYASPKHNKPIQESINPNFDKSNDEILDMNIPPISCIGIDESNYKKNENNLSLLHQIIATLGEHKDELGYLLSCLDFKFDIIGISEKLKLILYQLLLFHYLVILFHSH